MLPADFTQNMIRWGCETKSAKTTVCTESLSEDPPDMLEDFYDLSCSRLFLEQVLLGAGALQPLNCCLCPLISGFTGIKCECCLMYALSFFLLDNQFVLGDCIFHAKQFTTVIPHCCATQNIGTACHSSWKPKQKNTVICCQHGVSERTAIKKGAALPCWKVLRK